MRSQNVNALFVKNCHDLEKILDLANEYYCKCVYFDLTEEFGDVIDIIAPDLLKAGFKVGLMYSHADSQFTMTKLKETRLIDTKTGKGFIHTTLNSKPHDDETLVFSLKIAHNASLTPEYETFKWDLETNILLIEIK